MNKSKDSKKGKIIPNGVSLEKHEMDTVLIFTNLGHDVELIKPSLTPQSKRPDIKIDGRCWEMKSPIGKSESTLEHIFKKAAKQCDSIIIDLRRTKLKDGDAVKSLQKLFEKSTRVKHLKVIKKSKEIIDF